MHKSKLYFAPLEGITWYIYRNAHHDFFPGIEKYFAPFIVANQSKEFSAREWNDLIPKNNAGIRLIPQILTNKAEDFLFTMEKLETMGYREINLNLGCPSGTVVSKKKGSGFLAYPEELDRFLDTVFSKSKISISIKTRIGKDSPDEFGKLVDIFNQYPLEELIVHPRVQKDFYKNTPNMQVFGEAIQKSTNPLVYNGDLLSKEEIIKFQEAFPSTEKIMIGRGLIRNPGLGIEYFDQNEIDQKIIREFHDRIYTDYQQVLSGDRNVLYRMKEIWFYLIDLFPGNEKVAKKIRKSQSCAEYEIALRELF